MFAKLPLINYYTLKIIDIAQIYCTLTHPNFSNKIITDVDPDIRIISQQNEITCKQSVPKNKDNLKLVTVISQLLTKLPKYSYPKLSLKFKRIISLPGKSDKAIAYFQNNLLSESISTNLVSGQIKLTYQLNNCPLYFSLESALIREQNNKLLPALAFEGEFAYGNKDTQQIQQIINNWFQDWSIFTEIINQGFLG